MFDVLKYMYMSILNISNSTTTWFLDLGSEEVVYRWLLLSGCLTWVWFGDAMDDCYGGRLLQKIIKVEPFGAKAAEKFFRAKNPGIGRTRRNNITMLSMGAKTKKKRI